MSDLALLPRRRLHWPACYNVRDLGGLRSGVPSADGRRTRHGVLVRMDCPCRLTDAGWQALVAYGVRTIIDLRDPQEHAQEPYAPPNPLSAGADLDLLSLPLRCAGPRVDLLFAQAETLEEAYVITVDHCQANVVAVLRANASAKPGGIVLHCQSGRDRTAIVVALLLALVGVPAEVIAADYSASQGELWPRWEAQVAAAGGDEEAAGLHLRPLLDAGTMLHLLKHVEDRYGGAAAYLATIGITAEERASLVTRLLEAR